MRFVYLMRSIVRPDQRYTGSTTKVRHRLIEHNAGAVKSTKAYRPWRLVVAIAFTDDARAVEFERYLKRGSGAAFANRHLW